MIPAVVNRERERKRKEQAEKLIGRRRFRDLIGRTVIRSRQFIEFLLESVMETPIDQLDGVIEVAEMFGSSVAPANGNGDRTWVRLPW